MRERNANTNENFQVVHEPGLGTLEIFTLNITENFLYRLFKDLFENHWDKIQFGILIQGAVLEIAAPAKPKKVALFDGYLTVDFDHWHIHVCIGENKGVGCTPTQKTVADIRKPSRAELYRKLNNEGQPTFWALRMFNGKQEQLLTVFFPNPLLTNDMNYAESPDWSKLQLWDYIRKEYLGLESDSKDRTATKFMHD